MSDEPQAVQCESQQRPFAGCVAVLSGSIRDGVSCYDVIYL